MPKPTLRVLKWLGTIPAIAVCTKCNCEFKAPLEAIKRTGAAAEYLQTEFERHECATPASTTNEKN